jgi:hypothetical protein
MHGDLRSGDQQNGSSGITAAHCCPLLMFAGVAFVYYCVEFGVD